MNEILIKKNEDAISHPPDLGKIEYFQPAGENVTCEIKLKSSGFIISEAAAPPPHPGTQLSPATHQQVGHYGIITEMFKVALFFILRNWKQNSKVHHQ